MPAPAKDWPSSTLLARLSNGSRQELLRLGRPVDYAPRQTVISYGNRDRHALVLLSGCVKVILPSSGGYEALLGIRVGGDLVGEMAALEGRPRSASVVTCSRARARLITSNEFTSFLGHYPDAAIAVASIISHRLRWANRRRVDFRAYPAPVRVARLLAELMMAYGQQAAQGWELDVALSQPELASLAGVALTTLEKTMHSLTEDGILEWHYRKVYVSDVAKLRQIADLSHDIPY